VDCGHIDVYFLRLQFFGAGPKLPGLPSQEKMEKTRGVKLSFEYDPLAKYMCQVNTIASSTVQYSNGIFWPFKTEKL
jgi:hypothetical protein